MGEPTNGEALQARVSTELFRAKAVYDSVLDAIFLQIQLIDDGDKDAAKQTLARLGDLHRAYLGVKEAEKVFNDKHGHLSDGEIDFETLRYNIGRKLDRLRAANGSGGISGGADG